MKTPSPISIEPSPEILAKGESMASKQIEVFNPWESDLSPVLRSRLRPKTNALALDVIRSVKRINPDASVPRGQSKKAMLDAFYAAACHALATGDRTFDGDFWTRNLEAVSRASKEHRKSIEAGS